MKCDFIMFIFIITEIFAGQVCFFSKVCVNFTMTFFPLTVLFHNTVGIKK